MKKLVCEMCGGTDLVKQDGVFVCQSCGVKYTVEEAKKMMIEGTVEVVGTVKIDESEKIKPLLESADTVFGLGNHDEAYRQYMEILKISPNNFHALAFSSICQGWHSSIANCNIQMTAVGISAAIKNGEKYDGVYDDWVMAYSEFTKLSTACYLMFYNHGNEATESFRKELARLQGKVWDLDPDYLRESGEIEKARFDRAVKVAESGTKMVLITFSTLTDVMLKAFDKGMDGVERYLDSMKKDIDSFSTGCNLETKTRKLLTDQIESSRHDIVVAGEERKKEAFWSEHQEEKQILESEQEKLKNIIIKLEEKIKSIDAEVQPELSKLRQEREKQQAIEISDKINNEINLLKEKGKEEKIILKSLKKRNDEISRAIQNADISSVLNEIPATRPGGDEMRVYIAYTIYNGAVKAMNASNSESEFKDAAEIFKIMPGFKDADTLAEQCLDKAEVCRKDAVYASARSQMTGESAESYESAIKTFQTISGWKDADEQINACRRKIEEIKAKEEADRLEAARKAEERRIAAKKRKKIIAITTSIGVACIAFVVLLITVIIPKQKLNKAMGLIDSGDYEAAYAILEELGNNDAIASSKYDHAISLIDSGDYEAAYALLEEIGNSDAITSNKYERAVSLIGSGDYEGAYMLLDGLDYKDSSEQMARIKPEYEKVLLSKGDVGSYVFFGSYEQDNNTSNGNEDIEWLVLAKEDNKLLVISRYALDCQPYNTSHTDVTWETCSLSKWLNGTFISNAFSSDEQNMIQTTTVTADKNPNYDTPPGNNTTDKVFLLSIPEVNKYFSSGEARKCAPTDYAIAQGVYPDDIYSVDGKGTCWWWLRSPGNYSKGAVGVVIDGSVYDSGDSVNRNNGGVRPAMWIDFGS